MVALVFPLNSPDRGRRYFGFFGLVTLVLMTGKKFPFYQFKFFFISYGIIKIRGHIQRYW